VIQFVFVRAIDGRGSSKEAKSQTESCGEGRRADSMSGGTTILEWFGIVKRLRSDLKEKMKNVATVATQIGLQPVPVFDGLTGGTDGTEPVRRGLRGDTETGRVRDGLTR
jgi:hypothetical protein